MKPIAEMSHEELIALTEDDLDRMIRVRMAEEGIRILPVPVKPKLEEVVGPDRKVYTSGFFGSAIGFSSLDQLQQAIELLCGFDLVKLDHQYQYDLRVAKEVPTDKLAYSDPSTPSTANVYSEVLFRRIQDSMASNKQLTEAYEAEEKEYRAASDDAEWIREEIMGAYRKACNKQAFRYQMLSRFQEYLDIAENDVDVAMRFLMKAFEKPIRMSEDEEGVKNYIRENFVARDGDKAASI